MTIQPTTMLYRSANEPNVDVWGLCVEYAIFDDELVPDALKEGWFTSPLDAAPTKDGGEDAPKRRGRPPKEG